MQLEPYQLLQVELENSKLQGIMFSHVIKGANSHEHCNNQHCNCKEEPNASSTKTSSETEQMQIHFH